MGGPPDMGGATFDEPAVTGLDEIQQSLHDLRALTESIVERIEALGDDRSLLTPRTLAERLALSERTARQMLIDGVIPSFVVGEGARRIDPRAVDAYLRGRADA